jgi:hypothetical protein
MKNKIIWAIFCLLIINAVAPISTIANEGNSKNNKLENSIILTLYSEDLEFTNNEDEYTDISINNFCEIITPGQPIVPSKIFYVGLPPGCVVKNVEKMDIESIDIQGSYKLRLGSPIISGEELIHYYNVYNSNEPYPLKIYEYIGMSNLRKYSMAMIRFSPITYYPSEGRLTKHNKITLKINYKQDMQVSDILLKDTAMDDLAIKSIVNYDSIKDYYQPVNTQSRQSYDYVIISTSSLYSSISSFISYKKSLGFTVNYVNLSWITTNYPASDTQASIRLFLASNYAAWGTKYVLIVGSHNSIPMRTCYPDPNNHANDGIHNIPTDYYYADLTGSWDSDGDGFYGEKGQDSVDFTPEVWVGRIPVDVGATITSILNKIQGFEGAPYSGWKKNAMLLGAVYMYANEDWGGNSRWDGAEVMEECKNYLLSGFSITTMYEKGGYGPCSYSCTYPLTNSKVVSEWSGSSGWGIVNWAAHGAITYASRKVWSSEDGDSVPESFEMTWPVMVQSSDASSFNNNKPPIVFSASCSVSYPETANNLGASLIINGAVAFIGASRVSYGSLAWTQPSHGGHGSYCYYFTDNIANNVQYCGPALYSAKKYTYDYHPWNTWHDNANMYNFNLYGDPNMGMSTIPSIPDQPSGPTSGYTDIQYTYSTKTKDPTGDNVKYGWDWNGDGTVDEWDDNNGNYYPSGQQINTPHIFSSPGSFSVKVIAEDQYGLQSGFSQALNVVISQNQAPAKPSKPSGPTEGKPDEPYTFTTSTTDPEGYDLKYGWDWDGNGAIDEWDDNNGNYYPSGQQISTSHSWTVQGTYSIQVKCKDIHGYESSWSDPLEINIPRSKNLKQLEFFELLQRLLYNFPFFQKIINI